ncbi:MAG: helix-turn-helix transcriptional regulator [Armatimonas sp.]
MPRDLPKNDIPTLILAVLEERALHGYGIAREIERRSADALTMREGTLYPALRALEADGLIIGEWEIQPSGPARKVYSLTEDGRAEVIKLTKKWREYARTIESILGGKPDARPA